MRQKKNNQIILIIAFVAFLVIFGVLHILFPQETISLDEGRRLAKFPKLTYKDAVTGKQAENIEAWYSDQFPFRNSFITIGKTMRTSLYPNLNPGGIALYQIKRDLMAEDLGDTDPDTPPAPDVTFPSDPVAPVDPSDGTQPSDPSPPTTTKPEEPPIPTLPKEKAVEKGGLVVMGTRAMERFYGDEKLLKNYANRLNTIKTTWGANLNMYSLLAPTAIEIYAPEEYHSGYCSQQACLEIFWRALNPDIGKVNALDKLLRHRDEYIYYRTDHHWTGRGAYYAYVAFCEEAGWTPVPLSDMEHYQLEGTYLGSLWRATNEPLLKDNPDTTEGWRPAVESYTATAWDNPEMTVTYPIILNDERCTGVNSYLNYSGGDRALLKIATSNSSGRKLLVTKDSFGNALVPYFANHYDEVYIIDPRYYVRPLKQLVEENGITDYLAANYMFATSNPTWLGGFDKIIK
ncbi:MAG: hypothetical protein GX910_06095 [Clostridiaceae bacterium]|jgi:hypothetical protein|nr:hypothetical protein [Clostridiaceae bacterium]